jgi:predicted glycoside hydrolase/deacetylase ChbG (UPF0249 family)
VTTAAPVQPAIELIVNVDDLGLHPAVRRAVEDCGAAGTVTSASALANGPDQDALRPSYPGISLGAHLNIVRGAPLSPPREVRSLVGGNGLFLGSFTALAARALRGGIVRSEVRLEWSRQVAHLRARGLALSHLDSEQHAHHLPGLFGVACDVAREHGIAWVRRSDERFGGIRFGLPALRRAILRALAARAQTGPAVGTVDAVWGIADQGPRCTAGSCVRALRGLAYTRGSPRIIEVVCHPGRALAQDPAIPPSFGRMRVRALWEPEYRGFSGDAWRVAAAANNWRLTSFDRLRPIPSDDR